MDSWPDNVVASAFTFEGIHIHPSHLVASPVLSDHSDLSTLSYMEDLEEEPEKEWNAFEKLNITSTNSPPSPLLDYFSSVHSTLSEEDPNYYNGIDSTTPTPIESPISTKLKDLTRSNSSQGQFSFQPSFSFTDYTPTTLLGSGSVSPGTISPISQSFSPSQQRQPLSRRGSSAINSITPKEGGASMLRSFSSPVETQRQLDQRNSHFEQISKAMDSEASMVRSESCIAGAVIVVGGMRTATSGPIRTGTSVKTQTRFGADWGASLPMRNPAPDLIPFPYNLVANSTNVNVRNISRSHSISSASGNSHHPYPTARQNSLPFIHTQFSDNMSTPTSPISSRRPSFSPLTPIYTSPSNPLHETQFELEFE